ncbi:MAG: hypothetical protein HZA08_13690 [Nitrospirae bacterium]|nr:hypothetical protein [Nitrospirota bacterium]
MNKINHIKPDKIQSYVEESLSGEDALSIGGHIATCDICYKVYTGIKGVSQCLKQGFKKTTASNACPEEWEIAAMIKEDTPLDFSQRIARHIESCDYCLEIAGMYYKANSIDALPIKTPHEWACKAVERIQGAKTVADIRESIAFIKKISGFIRRLPVSLPPLPGYALAATAVILLMVFINRPQKDMLKIITITSTEKLTFKETGAPSSFGFMGRNRAEGFSGMLIIKDREELLFDWKEIKDAKGYTFSLVERSSRLPVIPAIDIQETKAAIQRKKLKMDEPYNWVISGMTYGGQSFEYTGEFILTR